MRVSLLTAYVTRKGGGVFTSVQRLAQTLHGAETRVEVFGLDDEFVVESAADWAPIRPQTFPVAGPAALGFAPGLGTALHAANSDLIHCHGIWMYQIGRAHV